MSYTISYSSSSDAIWMINNRVFRWFAESIMERYDDDNELIQQLELALAFHGISLEDVHETDPYIALRLGNAFLSMANEIADGRLIVLESTNEADSVNQNECRKSFKKLVAILNDWETSTSINRSSFDQT